MKPKNAHDRLTILRCKAANAASLAGCYAEEAEIFAKKAHAEAGDDHWEDWRLSDPSSAHPDNTKGLPDDWMGIAEMDLPGDVDAAPPGIYIASRIRHGHRWRILRDQREYPISSTWIDECGVGETESFADLISRCIREAAECCALVFYLPSDDAEGAQFAWAELGAALAFGRPVFAVADDSLDTKLAHPLVTRCSSLLEALAGAVEVWERASGCSFDGGQDV